MSKDSKIKKNTYEIAIIGAGFAGLGMGIRLKMKEDQSFIIFEREAEVGGTWRDNTYPGCGCDIPSFLYSYSFEPNPDWSRSFSPQAEIWNYLKHCVQKYKLEKHIRYNAEINYVRFDEQQGLWTLKTKNGDETTAKMVICAAGPFTAPMIPNIKGRETFQGEAFHSLNWNHDYDLRGKRVAVIGTGASAIQFIPEIAPDVEQMYIFQRTPAWVMPRLDKAFPEKSKQRFRRFPWYQRFWREVIYWFLEFRGLALFSKNKMREWRTKECLKHLQDSITDADLRAKLTPNYELGCKRVLISDDFYPTLERSNVELITGGVEEIGQKGILNKKTGKTYEVDVIIYGTGFYATQFAHLFDIIGLNSRNLFQEWDQKGGEAYYGMTINGFPNLLFTVGPNTGLGHNSIIHMMESQFNYILDYLKHLRKAPTGTYFDIKPEVQRTFNEKIQTELSKMVWSEGGCSSYYLKNMDGKNTSIWPGSTIAYRKQTKKVNPKDYNINQANEVSEEKMEEHLT